MANSRITNIPKIIGPSFGGVIYGLNISQSFSSEPTKLTLNIVNPNGSYTTPVLNDVVSVSFGDFHFQGIIWSYEFKESAEERTLEVVLIDNSIILDRKYVLLWKRGFLNETGKEAKILKTFDFSDETILVAVRDKNGNINWVEKALKKASQEAKKRDLIGKIKGSLILVGREKFPDSECDIPDNYYHFNDLKETISNLFNASDWPSDSTWKATHEGTLREVLSSWCADLGYDFYWDFSENRLQFYSSSRGIVTTLPDSTASNIISKQTGASIEGTFKQYGLAYTQKPKSPIKTLSDTKVDKWNYSVSPVSMSYFASKNGKALKLTNEDGDSSYGGRTIAQVRLCGLISYVNEDLRDMYCLYNGFHQALGWEGTEIPLDKPKIIDFLRKFEMGETIDSYEKFDAINLPNFDFWLVKSNDSIRESWKTFEAKMLTYEGRYYRIPDRPSNFYYCSPKMTANISVSVDPAPALKEPNSGEDFAGRYIYDRGGGQMSHDSGKIQETLKLKELASELEFCKPKMINLADAGLFEDLMECSDIISNKTEASKKNYLLICAKPTLVKSKLGFTAESTSGSNDMETTWVEEKNKSGMNKNCKSFEEALKAGACATYEELARKQAVKDAGGLPADERPEPPDWVSGLNNKMANGCKIKTQKGSVSFYLPSHSTLRVITTSNADISMISSYNIQEFTWTVGNPGSADNVAELRIANENITDPNEDTFQKKRNTELIRPADVDASSPNRTIKYVFVGEPQGIKLTPSAGLTSLDTTLSSDGFTTSATFSTRPPKPSKQNNMVRYVHSQLNRSSFNAS
jgi:hypothetical protein